MIHMFLLQTEVCTFKTIQLSAVTTEQLLQTRTYGQTDASGSRAVSIG